MPPAAPTHTANLPAGSAATAAPTMSCAAGRSDGVSFRSSASSRVERIERIDTERVEMAQVQRQDHEFPRLGDRRDGNIRETRMASVGLGCIAEPAGDPRRAEVE